MLASPTVFPNDPSQYAVVYQWWTPFKRAKVAAIHTLPILASIATLRYYCPEVAIYIIDYSPNQDDWQDYPERFGFEIVRQRCGLAEIAFRYAKMPVQGSVPKEDRIFMEHLSRPIDLWNFAHKIDRRYIIYSDSDIFWRASCLPVKKESNFIHCRDENSGVIYFDKESPNATTFFEVWSGLAMYTAKNRRFRERMYTKIPTYNAIQDEMVYCYIRQDMPELYGRCVRELSILENFNPFDYKENIDKIIDCKALHVMIHMYDAYRGYVAWLLREFQPAIQAHFSSEEIASLYSPILEYGGRYSLETIRDGILNTSQVAREEFREFADHLGISIPSISDPPI